MTVINPLRPPPRRREAIQVPEPTPPERWIKPMQEVRNHRLRKAELECAQLNAQCKASRQQMRQRAEQVVEADEQAEAFWRTAKEEFLSMAITPKAFVARKCRHQKLKVEAAALRSDARQAVQGARDDRQQLRQAKETLQERMLKVERLRMLQDLQRAEADASAQG